MKQDIFSIWQGVYSSFSDAGGDSDAFDTKMWIKKQKDGIHAALETHTNLKSTSKDYPLPIATGMVLSQKKTINILDFGGGMGLQYLECHSKIPEFESAVDYHIIEGASTIENRPDELNKFKNLHFSSDISTLDSTFDIIHVGSTLHYIEKWKDLLETMVEKFHPTYFVFSDLLVGNVPTFVSHQMFYGKKIPVLFVNLGEFLGFMKDRLGMKEIFRSNFVSVILSQEDVFPNFGLPKNYRIDRPFNLIFARSRDS